MRREDQIQRIESSAQDQENGSSVINRSCQGETDKTKENFKLNLDTGFILKSGTVWLVYLCSRARVAS